MPGINVGSVLVDVLPDARGWDARLQEQIRNVTAKVKIDLDDSGLSVKLDAIKAKLAEIGAKSPNVRVDVDTLGAQARLAALGAEADRTGDKTRRAGDSASGASGGLSALMQAAIGLSPALVPVGAAALGVAAALGTMAAAGAVGAGVLMIALGGVTKAVGLLGQQQKAQQAAASAAGSSAASNAAAIVSAQRQIASAEMSLGDARRAAAASAITASQQVQSAQYGLIQADRQERDALTALQAAREAATRQLTSMANSAVDARLAEQQAVLDLQTAIANNNATQASSTATAQQKAQAALDLQKAQQHLTEAQQANTYAAQDNAKAQKLGVDGSPQVVNAAQNVATAQHNQAQAAQTLANAQRAQADQQVQSAESIQRAQQGVAAAMDQMAAAQRQSSGSTSSSLAAINAQVAALDPATRRFAEYLRGTWAPIWKQVQSASAGGFLPGLQAGMDAMRSSMPSFVSFIKDISSRLGDMAKNVGQALSGPFWQSFFAFLTRTLGPALSALGTIIGNIATGFAGIWMAFEPIIKPITDGIVGISKKFADFGQQASGSAGFGKFIEYIRQTGPVIMKILGDLWTIAGHIIQALAPLGGPILAAMSAMTGILKQIPVPLLTAAAVAIGAIVGGIKLWGMLASLNPFMLILTAIGAAFLLVYTNSKTFRDFIANSVLPTLKDWWGWIKDNLLPAFAAIWSWIKDKLVPVLAGIFIDAWHGITHAVQVVSQAIAGHRKELGQVGDALAALGGFIVKYIVPVIGFTLKLAFELVGAAIRLVITVISKMVDAWNWLWGIGKGIGHWFANDFVGFFVGAWRTISAGWDGLVKGIAKLWNNLKHYLMDPVAFVVRYVIDDGLIKAWNWVVSTLHLPGSWHAAPMAVPAVPPLMAHGGVIPGYAPGVDSVHAILSPGEGVLVPEAVRGLGGPAVVHAINSRFNTRAGGPRMAGGLAHFDGGGFWGGLANIASDLIPGMAAAKAVSPQLNALMSDPLHAFPDMIKSLMGGLSSAAPMVGLLGDLMGSLAKGVGQAVWNAIAGSGSVAGGQAQGGNASAPTSQAANVAAVQAVANSYGWGSGSMWDLLVKLINRESGFRNTAQNPTSTAYGIFQFLDSTWASYGIGKTSDAHLQAIAGLRYIAQRYTDPLGAWRHEVMAGWYDNGGVLKPGYTLAYNGTGQNETIRTSQQEAALRTITSGASGGAQGPSHFTGNLYLDSGEFLGKVRGVASTEVDRAFGQVANSVHYAGSGH